MPTEFKESAREKTETKDDRNRSGDRLEDKKVSELPGQRGSGVR